MNPTSLEQENANPIATKRIKGFTLIELLVVIAIIALLAAILFPVFARARENARKSSCQNNLKQMGVGIAQYTQDYDEMFPRSRIGGYVHRPGVGVNARAPWHFAILPYTKSIQIYRCPSNAQRDMIEWSYDGTADVIPEHYLSNGGDGRMGNMGGMQPIGSSNSTAIADVTATAEVIMVGESRDRSNRDPDFWDNANDSRMQGHLGATNFLFCDGHVKSMKPIQTVTPKNMWDAQNRAAAASWVTRMTDESAAIDVR